MGGSMPPTSQTTHLQRLLHVSKATWLWVRMWVQAQIPGVSACKTEGRTGIQGDRGIREARDLGGPKLVPGTQRVAPPPPGPHTHSPGSTGSPPHKTPPLIPHSSLTLAPLPPGAETLPSKMEQSVQNTSFREAF